MFEQIPCTSDLLTTSGMQLALLVQPLALPHPSEESIQVIYIIDLLEYIIFYDEKVKKRICYVIVCYHLLMFQTENTTCIWCFQHLQYVLKFFLENLYFIRLQSDISVGHDIFIIYSYILNVKFVSDSGLWWKWSGSLLSLQRLHQSFHEVYWSGKTIHL